MRALLLILFLFCGALQAQSAPPRDVLATAFDYPFLTNIEVMSRTSNGGFIDPGGPLLAPGQKDDGTTCLLKTIPHTVYLRAPKIGGVALGGVPQKIKRYARDLISFEMGGVGQKIEILLSSPAGETQAQLPVEGVATPEEANARLAQLKPGEELIIRDGDYKNWRWNIKADGTEKSPVVIRPQTPGGATFHRDTQITLSGRNIIFRGFRFEQCGPATTLKFVAARDIRVTQCHFLRCGNPQSTFGHIVEIDMGCHSNQVDSCYFTGSKSMSLAQRISATGEVGTMNRFYGNIFRDIYRYWINGQENIQIGQNQRDPTGQRGTQCIVARNLFDHAWGDGEIISNKSSENLITYNVAAHCKRSAFTVRGGAGVGFVGNVMFNNGDGVRVMGKMHSIVNNVILDQPGYGIYFETGSTDGQNQSAADKSHVENNTIVNCGAGAIGAMVPTPDRPFKAADVTIEKNILTGRSGTLLDATNLTNPRINNNLFWPEGNAKNGAQGQGAVVANPLLEGEGTLLRSSKLILHGADKGARFDEEFRATLPPIPPAPLLNIDLFAQGEIWTQNAAQPQDGFAGGVAENGALSLHDAQAKLQKPLPDSFVLSWEAQADTFAARSKISFKNEGDEYAIEWGGAANDGKPQGVISLSKNNEVFADGTDHLLHYNEYRHQGWLGGVRNNSTAPDAKLWHRFTLLKNGGRFLLLLCEARRAFDPLPVIFWEDPSAKTAGDFALNIAQQGVGRWRGFAVQRYGYVGDFVGAPRELQAEAMGGSRVRLRWQAAHPALEFEVYRAVPGGTEQLMESNARGGFDDFEVQPKNRYVYRVRAVTPFGVISEGTSATVTTKDGGDLYRLVPVKTARLQAPMAMETQGVRTFLRVPPGTPGAMNGAPEGGAEVSFSVEQAGEYTLWGLVKTPDEGSDSFYTAVDGAPYAVWYTGVHAAWQWSKIAGPLRLEAGIHDLKLKHREPNAALGAILVTSARSLTE